MKSLEGLLCCVSGFTELVVIILLLGSPSSLFLLRSPHPSSASLVFLKPPPVLHLMKESVLDGEEFLSTLQPKQHLIPDSVSGTDREPSRVKHLPRILYHPSLLLLFLFLSALPPCPSHPARLRVRSVYQPGGYKLCISVYTGLTDADVSWSYSSSPPL